MNYEDFIASKQIRAEPVGIDLGANPTHHALYAYQSDVVRWALRLGRAAIFADCGLGKTLMQLEWAHHCAVHSGKPTLVVTPLAVGAQTIKEADKIDLKACRYDSIVDEHVAVINYQRLHKADPSRYGAIVLDESSILKNLTGSTRTQIIDFAAHIPLRLACTATPAPNDLTELLNHAAYLGIMSVAEAKAVWFVNDEQQVQQWRLKGHAVADFWRWVSTWAVAFRTPADIGHEQAGFDLPPYTVHEHISESEEQQEEGRLFASGGLASYRRNRQATVHDRVQEAADIINADDDFWVVWCDLNSESEALANVIHDAVEVKGSDSIEEKERNLRAFSLGMERVIVTKPGIAGHGLNWQHCNKVAFVGISHSYEQYYQAVRRVWRYGQKRDVEVHIFGTDTDRAIISTVKRKERTAMQVYDFVTPPELGGQIPTLKSEVGLATCVAAGSNNWSIALGDSVDTIGNIDEGSVGLSIFSPPFPGMYVYTDDSRDMGNVTSIEQMIGQYVYLARGLNRAMMPGRSVLIHITQGVAQKQRDGYVGLRDFRGQLIQCMIDAGFIHYGEITIDKNPQVKAVRTKDAGLMFVSLRRDSAIMHVAMPDMLLHFRAPGDNPEPIQPDVSNEEWIRWARPVWPAADTEDDGINETDTLNAALGRESNDERHICPLQLGLIRRAIRLWSNPGDLVYSPFTGIGSEGVSALKLGRRFAGGELKQSYFNIARENLAAAAAQGSMF